MSYFLLAPGGREKWAGMGSGGSEGTVRWRKRPQIRLFRAEKQALQALARRYTAPYRDVVRAKIVLLVAEGVRTGEIARLVAVPRQLVLKWTARFARERTKGLADRPRPGRPRTRDPAGARSRTPFTASSSRAAVTTGAPSSAPAACAGSAVAAA